jgi:hypothetical protein
MVVKTNCHTFGIDTVSNHEQNLELKTDNSTPTSTGLKVETVAISSPVSFESGANHFSHLNLLIKVYSKKKCSLISRSDLLVSKTVHISYLITKLQI